MDPWPLSKFAMQLCVEQNEPPPVFPVFPVLPVFPLLLPFPVLPVFPALPVLPDPVFPGFPVLLALAAFAPLPVFPAPVLPVLLPFPALAPLPVFPAPWLLALDAVEEDALLAALPAEEPVLPLFEELEVAVEAQPASMATIAANATYREAARRAHVRRAATVIRLCTFRPSSLGLALHPAPHD
jgi:hypothetical protein